MKILVEATPMLRDRSGIGQYVYRLFDSLLDIDDRNKYVGYGFLFFGKRFIDPYNGRHDNLRYRLVRYFPSKVYNVLARKAFVPPIDLLIMTKTDITIFTNFVRTSLPLGSKSITFVYDLSYKTFGQFSNKKNRTLLEKEVPKSITHSDLIITISENSKSEIVKEYRVDPQKVAVINPAINHEEYCPRSKREINRVKHKLKIKSGYILYTGTIEPRKNINGILTAYENLSVELRRDYALVLAGGKGWLDEAINARLNELKDLDIILTGYVDDNDLPALYSGASLFVFPSFYEGWGMPPLEAMACGVPVITSNNSSLPEVVGDAGIMVDAHDTDTLAKQVERVLTDKKLTTELVKRGLGQAAKFSWEKSAKQLQELIEEVGSK